jgi:hypothetical protein
LHIDQSQRNEGPTLRSDMRVRLLGARGIVVQKGIGETLVFSLTHASWAEPTVSVDYLKGLNWPACQGSKKRCLEAADLLCKSIVFCTQ